MILFTANLLSDPGSHLLSDPGSHLLSDPGSHTFGRILLHPFESWRVLKQVKHLLILLVKPFLIVAAQEPACNRVADRQKTIQLLLDQVSEHLPNYYTINLTLCQQNQRPQFRLMQGQQFLAREGFEPDR